MHKAIVIFGSIFVLVNGQYPSSQYLPQQTSSSQIYGPPIGDFGNQLGAERGGYSGGYNNGPSLAPIQQETEKEEEDSRPITIVKRIFVHVAEDDKSSGVTRVIKAPIKRERKVDILFVRAPAPAAPDRQVVSIPNDGGRKTLVYVLVKNKDDQPDPEFKLPKPTQASKPEIFFIRYKDEAEKEKLQKELQEKAAAGVPSQEYGINPEENYRPPTKAPAKLQAPQSYAPVPTARYGMGYSMLGQQPGGYHKK